MRVVGPFVREVLRATLAQRVTSLVTLLIVFGSAATVLATAGRSAGAEAAVLAEVDAAGTRSLSVYAQGEQPELASDLVARLADYDVVDAVSGFGPVTDVTAAAAPQGTRVAARAVYGNVAGVWTEGIRDAAGSGQAWVTLAAVEALGMEEQLGSVRYLDGSELLVTRVVELPAHLRSLDPVVLVPRDPGAREALTQLVVVARSPQDLPLVQALVLSALEDVPADGFRVESSQELAALRAAVGGELSAQGHGIVVGVLGAAAAATLVTIWSLALLRRRDFGRRRALGASRSMVVALVIAQVGLLAGAGAAAGVGAGLWILVGSGSPRPDAGYAVAAAVALALTATLASVLPALWASRRDPLTELRVA